MRGAPAVSFALFVLTCAGPTPAATPATKPDTHFAAIVFHDVVDSPRDLEGDAMTTDSLVAFLEWIKAGGMHPVTLDEVDAAGRGERALPEHAILITFDDGYRSLYTRVFPLLLAYKVPAVAALVGEWMDAPMEAKVRYGDVDVPRARFISWPEAREMADSGLVEFASHSYALHRTVQANPQGGNGPAAIARIYDPQTGYESEAQFRARIGADLARSRALMRAELGKAPRALAWPFGRYREEALQIAHEAGFGFAFTLEAEPADVATPLALARYLPSGNPPLGDLVGALRAEGLPPPVQALVCVDPARLAGEDFEVRLGRTIERMRRLGATAVAIDPFVRDAQGVAVAAWFPTSELPLRADLLSRTAWQLQSRGKVEVYLRMPAFTPEQLASAPLSNLARDLAAATWIDGLLFEDAPAFAAASPSSAPTASWEIRRRRAAIDISALSPRQGAMLSVFRAIEGEYRSVRLAMVLRSAVAPMAIADLTFVEVPTDERESHPADGIPRKFPTGEGRRFGAWITAREGPPAGNAVAKIARTFKIRGAMAAGWCPDDPLADRPAAEVVAPAVSASRSLQ